MSRLLAVLAVVLVILPLASAAYTASSQPSKQEYKLIAIPFFTQHDIVGGNGRQSVILYAFGKMDAFIDLNHNGKRDPGEPFANITGPNRLVRFELDAYYTNESSPGYEGDLWIFTKYPVMVEFEAVIKDLGPVASYNYPPPGRHFVVPDIPGVIYVSPAVVGSVSVRVNLGGAVNTYVLGPGDYLEIPNHGEVARIDSNASIAVVLGNPGGNGQEPFFAEIPPLNEDYAVGTVSPPFPESFLKPLSAGYNITSYVYVVSLDGRVASFRYGQAALLRDLLKKAGFNSTKGYAITLLYGRSKTGTVSLAAVPVYNFQALSQHITGNYSEARWVTVEEVYNYTAHGGMLDIVDGVPTAPDTWPAIYLDVDMDYKTDMLLRVMLHNYQPEYHFLVEVNTSYNSLVYQAAYWDMRYVSYTLHVNPTLVGLSARYEDYPVPWPVLSSYESQLDLKSGKYPFVVHKYNNTMIMPSTTTIRSSYGPGHVHIVYNHSIISKVPCNKITYYAALVTPGFYPVTWNKTMGCRVSLRYEANKLRFLYYAIPLPYVNGKVILDKSVPIVFQKREPIVEAAPPITLTTVPEGVKHFVEKELLNSATLSGIMLLTPPTSPDKMFNLLKLNTTPPPSPPPTTTQQTQTTTTRTIHTTISTTATTTRYQETSTTTQTGTTPAPQTGTAGLAIPVKTGDLLEYKVKVSGEGPKGKASGSGTLILKASVSSSKVTLSVEKNSVGNAYLAAVLNPVSDLFLAVASGANLEYQLPDFYSVLKSKCPVLAPQMDSKTLRGSLNVLYYKIDYTCKYSNGVLVYAKAKASGSVSGQSFKMEAEASLASTTIRGVKPGGGLGGSNFLLWAVIGVVAAIVAVVLLVVARRR